MKYIKKFNESKNSFEVIDRITRDDRLVDMPIEMFNRIKSLCHNDEYSITRDNYHMSPRISHRSISIGNSSIDINIVMAEDEWFYVSIRIISDSGSNYTYYKCDQFDGLIDLLRDRNIIPIQWI